MFRRPFCCCRPFREFNRNSEHVYTTQVLSAILRKVYNMLRHTLERDMSACVFYSQMARWHTLHLICFSVQCVYCFVTKFKRTWVRWHVCTEKNMHFLHTELSDAPPGKMRKRNKQKKFLHHFQLRF